MNSLIVVTFLIATVPGGAMAADDPKLALIQTEDALLTAFELGRGPATSSALETGYSDALTQHAVRAAAERAASLPLGRLRG